MLRVHCVVPEERSGPAPSEFAGRAGSSVQLNRVSAAIAKGKHPAPFRTRKLSLSAPMVLQVRTCGRVGRRRTLLWWGHPVLQGGPFHFFVLSRRVSRMG